MNIPISFLSSDDNYKFFELSRDEPFAGAMIAKILEYEEMVKIGKISRKNAGKMEKIIMERLISYAKQ